VRLLRLSYNPQGPGHLEIEMKLVNEAQPAPRERIEPLGKYVLLRLHDAPTTTRGGLALPESVARNMMPTLRATVVAVGPGLPDRNGNMVGCGAEVGDEVFIQLNAGVRVDAGAGEEFVVTTADMILAVVRPALLEE
jgi:chaperonin GroES